MTGDRKTSGRSSGFLSVCFFGEIWAPDNLSPSSLKELNKHRPFPVVPMNFLTRRQETRAGATGSKLPAALCVLRVRVRSGAGPITFSLRGPEAPRSLAVSSLTLAKQRKTEEERRQEREGKKAGKVKKKMGKERKNDVRDKLCVV